MTDSERETLTEIQRETEREGFRTILREKQRRNQIEKQGESFRPIVREKQRRNQMREKQRNRERVLDR